MALAGRAREPVLVAEAKWAKSVGGPRLLAELAAKAARLPGLSPEVRYALCAREAVRDAPEGVLTCTAADIFGG